MTRTWHLFVTGAIVLVFGLTLRPAGVRGDDSITVQVSVDAREDFGNQLSYQWRATDGNIVDQNSLTTDWTLPNGPGIHFAYVLVKNGKGGYTEGRIAVNTDGNPTTTARPRDQYTKAEDVSVPTAVSGTIKGTLLLDDASDCGTRNPFFGVNVNATVQFADNGGTLLGQAMVLNPYAYGQFAIADNPSGSRLVFTCENATLTATSFRNDPSGQTNFFIIRGTAQPEVKSMSAILNNTEIGIFPVPPVVPQGILPSDYLAGRESDNLIGPPPRFLAFKGLDTRKGSCEYYKSVGAVENCDPAGNYVDRTLTFDAWRNAVQIDEFCDHVINRGCEQLPFQARAVFVNKTDLNLTRDHHSVGIGTSQFSVLPGQLAAYVCNHPGPAPNSDSDPTGLFPSPDAVNAAINPVLEVDAAHPQGRNLIACVAMDRFPITSVTGQQVTGPGGDIFAPNRDIFTRFLVFGPNGDLLPSANLDGNGEKFVPGACVACHGGQAYFSFANAPSFNVPQADQPLFGGFPEGGVPGGGGANLWSYFLPYDVDNFAFHSSRQGFTKNDQQDAIFRLNTNALAANRNIAETNLGQNSGQETAFTNLFNGWYPLGIHVFNSRTYVPTSVYSNSESQSFYLNVVAPSCRTCHIAMDQANFEIIDPKAFFFGKSMPALRSANDLVCGQSLAEFNVDPVGSESSYLMPNSRTTFDRFWLSSRRFVTGQPANTVNQPETLRAHANLASCHLP